MINKEKEREKLKREKQKRNEKENKILEDWIRRNYGKKCEHYYSYCPTCYAWVKFEQLKLKDY